MLPQRNELETAETEVYFSMSEARRVQKYKKEIHAVFLQVKLLLQRWSRLQPNSFVSYTCLANSASKHFADERDGFALLDAWISRAVLHA
jgi:hypothetical protein